jgi:hypothetical protein
MKKLVPIVFLLFCVTFYAQSNCSQDIIFNGSWSGGSGANGAPGAGDEGKGIYIQSDVKLSENIQCDCLAISNGATLSVESGRFLSIQNNLILNGDLRLLGTSQLIQKHTGASGVIGNGRLYKDQSSPVNDVYRYTYWSSPVVSSINDVTFNVGDIMFDGTQPTTETSTLQSIQWLSFNGTISSLDGAATSPVSISNYWIYSYRNGENYNSWQQKLQTGTFTSGEGFTMKGTGVQQNYTFAGTPNDGTIILEGRAETVSLIGNPYPSAIDIEVFFRDNPHIKGLYFWDHEEDLYTSHMESFIYGSIYAPHNLATSVSASKFVRGEGGLNGVSYETPGRYIPVGQAFMVFTDQDRDIVFNNNQRVFATKDSNDTFFITQDEEEHAVLKFGMDVNIFGRDIHQQASISFMQGNTFADEPGYDTNLRLLNSDIYFRFPQSSEDLIIAGIQQVERGLEFPISLMIEDSQTIKLMVDEMHNINHEFVLIDTQTGNEYDIVSGPISINLAAGSYNDRFVIQFRRPLQEINLDNDLLIYSNNREIILKPFNDTTIQNYVVYNVLGQKVMSATRPIVETNEVIVRVPSTQLATGVLLVKVQTDKGLFTKKLLLH